MSIPIKFKFEGCHLQLSQRELANETKSWPDQKKLGDHNIL